MAMSDKHEENERLLAGIRSWVEHGNFGQPRTTVSKNLIRVIALDVYGSIFPFLSLHIRTLVDMPESAEHPLFHIIAKTQKQNPNVAILYIKLY